MILGLTGSIGCGKSTVSRIFETLGWHRLDADEIVREHLLKSPAIMATLQARWGEGIVGPGGLDRAAIAQRVFTDDTERLWLESVLHPEVAAHWEKCIATDPQGFWVVEVPLLFEKHLENKFDLIACVATSSARQIARLEERGLSQMLAEQRISKQLPLAQKCELADFVLSNDGSLDFLRSQAVHLHRRLHERS